MSINDLDQIGRGFIGLYRKYNVSRTDGQSGPGEKHDGCEYFVLDLTHDPHALAAIRAYAKSCEGDVELRELSHDLKMAAFSMGRGEPAFARVASRPKEGGIVRGILPSLDEVKGKAKRLGDSIRGSDRP